MSLLPQPFYGVAAEVWGWISDLIWHYIFDVIIQADIEVNQW